MIDVPRTGRAGHLKEITNQGIRPSVALQTSLTGLARSGAIAGVIKLASAGLSFFMFLAMALVTDERQFGLFGAAYAGASLVSFFSPIGQQSVVLRFWPQHAATAPALAQSYMARSLLVAGAGLATGSAGLLVIALIPGFDPATPEWLPLCLSTSLLAFALGWSEVASAALRAKALMLPALLPRDIIWRGLVIASAGAMLLSGTTLSGAMAILLCGLLLMLSVVPQTIALLRETFFGAERRPLDATERREFYHVTTGLWGVTSLPAALAQASTVLVAMLLGPELAGGVFVAERTARLVEVAQTGINQALAPEISSAYHAGRVAHVQQIAGLTALASTIVAVLAVFAFWLVGEPVLAVFEPSYANQAMLFVLLILSAGAVLASACGPVGVLLQLTGAQDVLFRILITVYPVGFVALALLTWAYGPIGAAVGMAATSVAGCILAVIAARAKLHMDPSLLGLLARARH